MTPLGGVSFRTPKGCVFCPWSGHIPRLWVWSLVGVCTGGNQLMFLSHISVSLCLSFSQISKTYHQMRIKNFLQRGKIY